MLLLYYRADSVHQITSLNVICKATLSKKSAFYTFAHLNRRLYNPEIAKGDF
jgi:hypothetical protein